MATKLNVLQVEGVPARPDLIKSHLKRYGVDVPKRANAKRLAELLRETFKERIEEAELPESEWIKCPACGEITDDDDEIEVCPYCGDEGEEPENAAPPESDDDGEEDDDEEEDDADPETEEEEDDEEEDDEEEKDEEEKDEEEKDPVETALEEAPEDDEEETPEEAEAVAEAKAEKKKPKAKKPKAKKPAKKPKAKTEIVEKEKGDIAGNADVRDFDTIAAEIDSTHRDLAASAYDLGVLLTEIYEGESWKKAGFKSFKDAATKRFGYTEQFARGLIRATRAFGREDFAVGSTKLILLASVEDSEQRGELLEKAKKGATRRDLKKEIKEKKDSAKKKGKDTAPEKEDKKERRGRPRKEDQTITLIGKVGGKAKTHRFIDRETGKELKEWKSDSYVSIKLSEEVVLLGALKVSGDGKITGFSSLVQRIEDDPE